MIIRPERPDDLRSVHTVNEAAFGSATEATLVDRLRVETAPIVSLVADDDGTILGHILFSPVTLRGRPELHLMGLAPMAVLPNHQRRGIGSGLARAGLDACRQLGCDAVVVLGHPEYYPRFGFVPASRFGLRSEYDVPDKVFMALELRPASLGAGGGTIRYHPAFAIA
jgi:putative acetyltransferase